jgi:hypothetical protein
MIENSVPNISTATVKMTTTRRKLAAAQGNHSQKGFNCVKSNSMNIDE